MKNKIFGIILTSVSVACSIAFVAILASTKILYWQLLALIGIGFAAGALVIFLLSKNSEKKVRSVLAAVLAAIIIIAQIFGSYYALVGRSALEKMTEDAPEKAQVGVFVRIDDSAQKIEDAKDYPFGILADAGRSETDKVIDEINTLFASEISKTEFQAVDELADALINEKTVDAIIVDKAQLDMLEEAEGHEDDMEKIREIFVSELDYTEEAEATPAPETESTFCPQIKNDDVFTVYFSGTDCHGTIKRRSRSDVNIIATVNVKTGQILLISTPRDYFVPLSISGGVPDKLTHAGNYGVNVSKQTLEMLYGTDIDYYFRVNFDGFEKIVNALGGITVENETFFHYDGKDFVKGNIDLNAENALLYVRCRKQLSGGDRQRGKNQMAAVKGIINKMISPVILTNYKEILDSVASSIDMNISYDTIAELIKNQVENNTKWNVTTYSVDGTGQHLKPYSLSTKAYVMVPNQATVEHAKDLIDQVKKNEVPTP